MKEDIKTILSGTDKLKHILHLYTSVVNKYVIQAPFLAMTKMGEKAIYVTNEDSDSVLQEFKGLNVKLSVIRPESLINLKTDKDKLRVVIDAGSFSSNTDYIEYEKKLSRILETNSHSILCTYPFANANPDIIKQLVASHDKLILTTGDISFLSSESFDELDISDKSIEKFVKNELEMIVLALILKEPMCGTDIIKTIHKNFNVLLSPGTVYPLLHTLEKNGLLKCEYGIKRKIYKPAEAAKTEIKNMLNQRVQVSRILSKFLLLTEIK